MNKLILVVLAFAGFVAFAGVTAAQQPTMAGDNNLAVKAWAERWKDKERVEYTFRGTRTYHKSGPKRLEAAKQSRMYSVRKEDVVLNSTATLKIDSVTGNYRLERQFEDYNLGNNTKRNIKRVWTYDGSSHRGHQVPSGNATGDTFAQADEGLTSQSPLPDFVKYVLPDLGCPPIRNDRVVNHDFFKEYRHEDMADLLSAERGAGVPNGRIRFVVQGKQPGEAKVHIQKIDCITAQSFIVERIARFAGGDIRREITYRYKIQPGQVVLAGLTDKTYFTPSEVEVSETYEVVSVRLSESINTDLAPAPGETAVKLSKAASDDVSGKSTRERYRVTESGEWKVIEPASPVKSRWLVFGVVLLVILLCVAVGVSARQRFRRRTATRPQ